ncbi:MAG: methyl-accepting chemotaxis protein [Thermodesulfobacteriota bacterium]
MATLSFRNLKIKMKIIVIVVTSILISVGVIGGYTLYKTVVKAEADIVAFEQELMKQTRQRLKDLTDATCTVVEKAHEQTSTVEALIQQYGENLSSLVDIPYSLLQDSHKKSISAQGTAGQATEEARRNAIQNIKAIRFGSNDYFWLNDTKPRMVMHPIVPDLDGKDLSDFSKNGKLVLAEGTQTPMFQEMARICKTSATGDGFVSYFWPDPNDTEKWVRKLSYVRLFRPWKWIVGTGVYVHQAERQAQERLRNVIASMKYGEGDYFFILDTDHTMVAHPNGELVGKNMRDTKDPQGKFLFQEMVETARSNGEGFVSYMWPKTGSDKPEPKLSCVRLFKPWGWIIATGVYVDGIQTQIQLKQEMVQKDLRNQLLFMGIIMVIFIVAAFTWVLHMSRKFVEEPISQGVDAANRLAKGDLNLEITVSSEDEIGQLQTAMKNMVSSLKNIVVDVKTSSDYVASGSVQLSATAEQMSQGATEQASAAEEASASMEEMSSSIKQNADNALQTEKIAIRAAEDAQQGGEAVAKTVSAMREISDKITIIEEIARQTNMLALNAAIEAARAGEHGKGFAVVADAVRKLAERSQSAAGEIRELSAESVEIAEKAGEMLDKIVPDIRKTADLVQEISAASNEQSTGAEQVNQALQQLDQVIQQNASASEEMSSTAEELSAQAEQLQQTMSFFTIDIQPATGKPAIAAAAIFRKEKRPAPGKKPSAVGHSSASKGVMLEMRDRCKEAEETEDEFERY